MKKTILSLFALLLSLTSLLALESVTKTYTYGYNADSGHYDWSTPRVSPFKITWSAEPCAETASDGSSLPSRKKYQVTLTIVNNGQNSDDIANYNNYYDWHFSLVGMQDAITSEVTCNVGMKDATGKVIYNDPLIRPVQYEFLKSQATLLVVPEGTSLLHLFKSTTLPDGRKIAYQMPERPITYQAEITNKNGVITPPQYIIFAAPRYVNATPLTPAITKWLLQPDSVN